MYSFTNCTSILSMPSAATLDDAGFRHEVISERVNNATDAISHL